MSVIAKFLRHKKDRKDRKSVKNPLQVIAVGFSIVILAGAFLLMLPVSSQAGEVTDPLTALFTATSATCVTGLVLVDTGTYWSNFGHWVILLMIQIGGMGFMLFLTTFSILVGRRITIRERLLISKSISLDNMSGIVKLAKRIIGYTLLLEGFGALILTVRFIRDFPFWSAVKKGIFHAVSAFCNAGFDLLGEVEKFSSLMHYNGDFSITVTISLLIILGGLGFYVWDDVLNSRRGCLNLHSKIVLTTTAIIVLTGTLFFLVAEWNNPMTMGNENIITKTLSSFFQSVTCRTAGFNSISQADMTPASKAFSIVLMFIGGSPGSTAGGVKTVTLAVLVMAAIATLKGRNVVSAYGRSISMRHIMDAITVVMVGMTFVLGGTFLLSIVDAVSFETALFECVSAFATVGLSEGITPTLSAASQIILIGLMYMGRVGIITLGLAILVRNKKESKIKYPEGKIIVG